jgi:hypothetical protein
LLGGGILAAGLAIGASARPPEHQHGGKESDEGKPATVQGELVDTACFVTEDAKGKERTDCAQKCMSSGIAAGILPEGSKDSDGVM